MPAGQRACVADVEPASQKCPALHAPEHDDDFKPSEEPYLPAGHAMHDSNPSMPLFALYVPTGHFTH